MRRLHLVPAVLVLPLAWLALHGPAASARPMAQPGPEPTRLAYGLAATWAGVPWTLTPGRYGEAVDIGAAPDANGPVYVLDRRHGAIHVLAPDAAPLSVLRVPRLGSLSAERLDVGTDGVLHVLSGYTTRQGGVSRLDRLSPEGLLLDSWEWEEAYSDVAVRADGRIYLVRPGDSPTLGLRGVDVLAADGGFLETIHPPEMDVPRRADIAADGTVYILQEIQQPAPPRSTPGPRPTPGPSGPGARQQQAPTPIPGVIILRPDHQYVETVPFDFGLDVAVGSAGVYVSRYGEVYGLRASAPLSSPVGQRWSGALSLEVTAAGRLLASLSHCAFEGVLGYDTPLRPGQPWLKGALDRPELEGPVYPLRVAADVDVLALQGRFLAQGDRPLQMYYTDAVESQSAQRWSAEGQLVSQLGLCTVGGESGWTRDVAASGPDVYTVDGGCVEHRPDDAFPAWTYCTEGSWGTDRPSHVVAVSAHGDRVAVLDAGAGGVVLLGRDGTRLAAWLVADAAVTAPPVDIALGAERVYLAEQGLRRIAVRGLDGAALGAIEVADYPAAVDVGPTGDVFVLGRGGWAYRYGADGTPVAAWPMPSEEPQPRDLAVDAQGRVIVPFVALYDGDFFTVTEITAAGLWVFEPRPSEEPLLPPGADGCRLRPDKVAAPGRLPLGRQVDVTLRLDGTCPPETAPLQLVVVMDTSRSMNWRYAFRDAQFAVLNILPQLDPRSVEVALVAFADNAGLAEPLGRDLARLTRHVAALRADGDTRMGQGLDLARLELSGAKRNPQARQVILLVSDGVPKDPDETARALAAVAAERIDLVALVFEAGQRASLEFLDEVVINGGDLYYDVTALQARSLARALERTRPREGLLERVTVTDEIPANMRYVAGSAEPAAALDGRVLTWTLGETGLAGLTLRYRLQPLEVGTWPTNVRADGDYVDVAGHAGRVVFPVPVVEVYDDVQRVFLPYLSRGHCVVRARPVDVVLVLDTSESMGAPAPGGGTKLDAARAAAGDFVGLLALPFDRAAVVSFNSGSDVVQGLTGDRVTLKRALDSLATSPGTRVDLGLAAVRAALAAVRSEARPAVVLLTDGRQSGDTAPVVAEAAALKDAGAVLFAVGLGADVDAGLLQQVASEPDDYFESPTTADLATIYGQISERLACDGGG